MAPPDPGLAAFAVLLGAGALLSLLVRSGRWPARAAAVLAMLALAAGALLPPRPVVERIGARVAVAATAPADRLGLQRALDATLAAAGAAAPATPGPVATVAAAPDVAAALARAALDAGPRAGELLVAWNGAARIEPVPAPVGGAFLAVAPLPFEPDEVRLVLQQPPRAGRPAALELAVPGLAAPLDATVRVLRDGVELVQQSVTVPVAGAATIEFAPAAAGEHVVELAIDCDGHRVGRTGTFAVAAPPRVLVFDASGVAAAALQAQGIEVVAGPSAADAFGDVAAVVVGDALPVAVQAALAAAVDDGLGLCVFGPGVQQDGEPLRAVLPIRVLPAEPADGPGEGAGPPREPRDPEPRDPEPGDPEPPKPQPQPEHPPRQPPQPSDPEPPPAGDVGDAKPLPGGPAEVDKRSVAMVLVIDRSESMGDQVAAGATKMSFAKTSARETAAALGEGDQVGIVTFGFPESGRVALPLTAATDREAVQRGIAALAHAPESTYVVPGLRLADEMLSRSTAAVRHVVVVTDGMFHDHETVVRSLVHEMRSQRGVTTSLVTIVTGETPPDFKRMSELIARDGGGVFLAVEDASRVPRLVSAEVTRSLGKVGRTPRNDERTEPASPGDEPQPSEPDRPDPEQRDPKQPEPKPPEPKTGPEHEPADAPEPERPQRLAIRAVAVSPLLEPPPAPAWPTLGGVVRAAADEAAHVLLVAGDAGLPLLAYGNRGLGRIAAIATDLGGEDAAELRGEHAFPARFAQWVTAVLRPVPSRPVAVEHEGDVTPPAPTPRDVDRLTAVAGRAPEPLAALRVPPPRTVVDHESVVPEAAAWCAFGLCLLALVEWWAARR